MRKLLAVLAFLFVPAAHAVTLEELLQKNLAARGGPARLAALQSVRFTGRVVYGDGDSSVELGLTNVVRRPGQLRVETSLQGMTAIRAWDGRAGWRVSPFGGRKDPERMSSDDAKDLVRSADLDGPLVNHSAKGIELRYLGTEDVDGTDAHKIQVVRPGGDIEYVFLDPDHFLEIRVETRQKIRGVERIEERDLGSYEAVAGVYFPFSIEAGAKGGPRGAKITIEHAEANVALDEALFRFPEPGARPLSAAAPRAAAPARTRQPPPRAQGGAPRFDAGVISGLGARNIGSGTMSGRVAAVAAYNQDGKTTIFVGAASGGVWKSVDSGTTFRPVFDKQAVQSIGAIAVDPRDRRNVWVGTGESWTRNSVSFGDGIYKSIDGGETWTHMGLRASERIARIVVDPRRSDVVYACVPGRLFSDSADRGVYRTGDGGKTWQHVLKGENLSTGCASLALDPSNPDRLIAGSWDFRRKGWTYRSGGEAPDAHSGSAIHETADGGRTWREVPPVNGLPAKPWGRSEIAFAPSNAKIVYAFIESKDSALYRSDDGGRTWQKRDKSQMMVWRPFYFARLIVDPKNPERVFKPNLSLIVSEDGGKSFSPSGGGAHGDWHDLWINPDNPKHVIGGDDGGLWISHDGGSRWWKTDNLPISQFYHVAIDDEDPYRVYGGLQDNGSWVGDTSYPGGITPSRWENLGFGDGFYVVPDPFDKDIVYWEWQGGFIYRLHRKSRALRDIQPKAGYREKLRYNWNAPIHASPTTQGTIYLASQFLFRSRDRGDTWERISPDLTTNDPQKQRQEESGGVTVDNSSAEMHTTIYAVSESPKNPDVIWVGTDDGNVQVTRDAGKTWQNVTANLPLPKASWVSSVEASRFDEGTALATFDRHTFGDFDPYVLRTRDYGQTWERIAGADKGLRGYAHVARQDIQRPGLLYAGTEQGLFISIDDGKSWAEFKGGNFPSVAVRDLAVHPREGDLVVATHGRGIWVIDDLAPLRALTAETLGKDVAFLATRPAQQRISGAVQGVEGDARFVGENPPGGAGLAYHQLTRHLFGPLKLEILDEQGHVVDTLDAPKRRGINRVSWPGRLKPPRVPRAAQIAGWSTQGPRVAPGKYRARLVKGSQVVEHEFEIGLDRRAHWTVEDRKAQLEAVMKVHGLFGAMNQTIDRIELLRRSAEQRMNGLAQSDPLRPKLQELASQAESLRRQIVATKEGGAITGEERIREHVDTLYGALMSWEGRPAPYLVERIGVLQRELGDVAKELERLVASQVPSIDEELQRRKLQKLRDDELRAPPPR